jgi:hypothetical protein
LFDDAVGADGNRGLVALEELAAEWIVVAGNIDVLAASDPVDKIAWA